MPFSDVDQKQDDQARLLARAILLTNFLLDEQLYHTSSLVGHLKRREVAHRL